MVFSLFSGSMTRIRETEKELGSCAFSQPPSEIYIKMIISDAMEEQDLWKEQHR